jgi:hypothetical protein
MIADFGWTEARITTMRNMMAEAGMIRVLSLGAGVQSSTVALMIARGDLPMVDAAIFADTGWEPRAVYEWLEWLKGQLPFPVHTVSAGNIRSDALAKINTTGQRFASVPWFTLSSGKVGMVRRQCTKEYKLRPLQRKVVELMGGRPKSGCEMLVGISMDEIWRMKPSRVHYIRNAFPLIDLGMTRQDCLRWMEERQYPRPPKSSCIGCPFHSDNQWRDLTPEEFADAVEVDKAIRHQPGMRAQQFMHRSCKPLDQVDLSTAEERGQMNLFNNECEGMCGV